MVVGFLVVLKFGADLPQLRAFLLNGCLELLCQERLLADENFLRFILMNKGLLF